MLCFKGQNTLLRFLHSDRWIKQCNTYSLFGWLFDSWTALQNAAQRAVAVRAFSRVMRTVKLDVHVACIEACFIFIFRPPRDAQLTYDFRSGRLKTTIYSFILSCSIGSDHERLFFILWSDSGSESAKSFKAQKIWSLDIIYNLTGAVRRRYRSWHMHRIIFLMGYDQALNFQSEILRWSNVPHRLPSSYAALLKLFLSAKAAILTSSPTSLRVWIGANMLFWQISRQRDA